LFKFQDHNVFYSRVPFGRAYNPNHLLMGKLNLDSLLSVCIFSWFFMVFTAWQVDTWWIPGNCKWSDGQRSVCAMQCRLLLLKDNCCRDICAKNAP